MKYTLFFLSFLLTACSRTGNTEIEALPQATVAPTSFGIDSVLALDTAKPFNGVIFIAREGRTLFAKSYGFADLDRKIPLKLDDQFVIGSISKQITAVIILREYERGHLSLYDPIGKYYPDLKQPWKNSITIEHLLTHTHGLWSLNARPRFEPGSQFAYSNFGYGLLAEIAERASGKPFAVLARELFAYCGLEHTFYPGEIGIKPVKSYGQRANDSIVAERDHHKYPMAAGGFISTAADLAAWNTCLHGGKLLHDSTYRLMVARHALRHHRVFGVLDYGYGISTSVNDSLDEISHSGYAEGFVSINYYFPETQTSLIVLENIARGPGFDQVFAHHLQILNSVRKHLKASSPEYPGPDY